MRSVLNITNGDCAVEIMEKADIPGEFLPWRDVLHEGPVPAGLSLRALSEVRAQFISDSGWADAENVRRDFNDRDNTVESFENYEAIILWFEHDLYDQLQLLQILDWFNENRPKDGRLSIICVDQYLGTLTPDEMLALLQYEKPVGEEQYRLASRAWSAFRSETPEEWYALLNENTSALPFLDGAIRRMLEEFPDSANGLSRTACRALEDISGGESRPGRVFGENQKSEERRFMGDSSFWVILHELLASSPPLLTLPTGKQLTLPTSPDQALSVTAEGDDVLSGKRNWLDIVQIDRWKGGTHLTPDNLWCWDSDSSSIARK